MSEMKLSPQAVGAIMFVMQNAIKAVATGVGDANIPDALLRFNLEATSDGLIVKNPPIVDVDYYNKAEEQLENLDIEVDEDE